MVLLQSLQQTVWYTNKKKALFITSFEPLKIALIKNIYCENFGQKCLAIETEKVVKLFLWLHFLSHLIDVGSFNSILGLVDIHYSVIFALIKLLNWLLILAEFALLNEW
jgi:hypothetical protein